RYEEALEHLNRAIGDENIDFLDAHLYRGKLYAAVYENELARQDLDFCIAHSPDNKLYYEERAGFHERNGDIGRAITDYGHLIRLDPTDFFPYVMRADLYEKSVQLPLAVEDYDRAIA